MTRCRMRVIGALIATAVLAGGWLPGPVAGESRRRGGDKSEARGSGSDERSLVEHAIEAAERAGVSRRDVRELTELCERGGFSESQTARIFSLAAQLALEELPVESFAAKIGEGVSKRIDPDRIVQVAERRALHLNRAKSILNGVLLDGSPVRDREELIPDVAAALEAGQSAEQVRQGLEAGFDAEESIGEIRRRIFP